MLDSASDPNANFGNMFSLWDQFFGTAKFQTAYPQEYGLAKENRRMTGPQLTSTLLLNQKIKQSDWHKDFQQVETATNEALSVST